MASDDMAELNVTELNVALRNATEQEAAAKMRLQQLQRQVRQKARAEATQQKLMRKQAVVAAMRAELDQKDLRDSLAGVRPASREAVRAFSEACNMRLCELHAPSKRLWIRLFKRVDADNSGLISFTEFSQLVRDELAMDPESFSELDVKRTWLALDTDNSGRISAGEFGHFMRLGHHVLHRDGGGGWRERLLAVRRATAEQRKAEKDAMLNKHVARDALALGVVASDEEVRALSEAFQVRLDELRSVEAAPGEHGCSSWYSLFKRVDTDGSGLIDFEEMKRMVREGLGLAPSVVSSDALKALWVKLDTDGSGLISAGEFGAFVRMQERPMVTLSERRARLQEQAQKEAHTVRVKMLSLQREKADERAREYQQQVLALEAALSQQAAGEHATLSKRGTALPAINATGGSTSARSEPTHSRTGRRAGASGTLAQPVVAAYSTGLRSRVGNSTVGSLSARSTRR